MFLFSIIFNRDEKDNYLIKMFFGSFLAAFFLPLQQKNSLFCKQGFNPLAFAMTIATLNAGIRDTIILCQLPLTMRFGGIILDIKA